MVQCAQTLDHRKQSCWTCRDFSKHTKKITCTLKKPVKMDQIGALVAQASDTIVFDNIQEYPQWSMVDLLFVNRKAQARVLGCDSKEVVQRLSEVMRQGPKPLKEISNAPCQERVWTGSELPPHRPPYRAGPLSLYHRVCPSPRSGDKSAERHVPALRSPRPKRNGHFFRDPHGPSLFGSSPTGRHSHASGRRHRLPSGLGTGRCLLPSS